MEKVDGRHFPISTQEERRRIAVRMKEQGSTLDEIQSAIGMCHSTICRAWKSYKQGGKKALKNGLRGRKKGEQRNLSFEQEKILRKKIIDRCPEQMKLDFALWTRDAVRQLIKRETGIDMPIRTVGEYLKRWGFTPQKPLKFAYERKPEAVKKWLDETFPKIRMLAKAENAEIYWGDETALQSSDVRGRGFAPRGETPIIHTTAKYENLSMISAITNKGRVHWMIVDGTVNIERFLGFLKGLIKYSRRKIFLIVDNLKVHHAIKVTEWQKKHDTKIALFFLPAYSPDLNPDEHLNADLKQGVGSRAPGRTKNHLLAAAENHLAMLKTSPERIRKYFKDPAIAYASI
jgi:transposase